MKPLILVFIVFLSFASGTLGQRKQKAASAQMLIVIGTRSDATIEAPKIVPMSAWREIISTVGGFKISFPGVPKSPNAPPATFAAILPPNNSGSYYLQTAAAYFNLSFRELTAGKEDAAKLKEFYDKQSAAFAAHSTLKLINESEVKASEFAGRERTTGDKAGTTVTKSRIFLARGYLYEFGVTVDNKLFDKQQEIIDHYLNSFQITNEPPAPLAFNSPEAGWKEFTAPAGEFKASFPSTPEKIAGKGDKEQRISFRAVNGGGFYEIGYFEMPFTVTNPALLDDFYNNSLEYLQNNPKIKIIETRSVTNGKYRGREVSAQAVENDSFTKMQVFLIGNRYYQLVYASPLWENAPPRIAEFYEKAATRFFSSFQPLGNAPAVEELAEKPATKLPENYKGAIKQGVYTNDFLGFSLKLPVGWKSLNAEEEGAIEEIGKQFLQKEDAKFNARLESAMENSKDLLSLNKKAFGLPGNAGLTIELEINNFNNAFPLREIAVGSQKFLRTNFNLPLKIMREVYETKIGGETAFAFDFQVTAAEESYRQRIYLLKRKGFTMIVALSYGADADLAEMEKSLQTITFTAEK